MSAPSQFDSDRLARLRRRIEQSEKTFGRGRTYSTYERRLIERQVIPEWLARALRVGSPDMVKRARRAIDALENLHSDARADLSPKGAWFPSDDGGATP